VPLRRMKKKNPSSRRWEERVSRLKPSKEKDHAKSPRWRGKQQRSRSEWKKENPKQKMRYKGTAAKIRTRPKKRLP